MGVRKVKGSWWVDFMFQQERLRKRSPDNSKSGAQAYEAHLRRLVAQHGSIGNMLQLAVPKPAVETLATFAPRWLREYVEVENRPYEAQKKRLLLRKHLVPAFGTLALNEITPIAVDRYKREKLSAGLAPKTVNNHLSALHKCLDKAREWELVPFVPRFSKLPMGPVPFKYLSATDVDRLLAAAADSIFFSMIVVAVRMGLRYSEIIALEWDDVDFQRAHVCVRRSEVRHHVSAPKNRRIRYVPMTSDVVNALSALRRIDARVFSGAGGRLTHATARLRLLDLCAVAGVQPIGWHALRHTFASELVQRGVALPVVKDLLGHSSLDMTLRYAHVSPELMQAAIATLEPGHFRQPVVNRAEDPEMPTLVQLA